ncbi:MAG: pyrimidine/purine nucleoside phosphorylase [Pseudomonadota bacterium]|nr:MAG: pyrimidine/purine nucleoside phosphorylase [Pseudomonadota bacterium]
MVLKNVDIQKKAEISHGGRVACRSIVTADGEMKSLGLMLPGTFRFSSERAETIEITQGHCRVKLESEQAWSEYESGQTFDVPANSHYEIEVTDLLDYVCHLH